MKTATEPYVRVRRTEYRKLKELEKRFARFWAYFEHLNRIREARGHVAKKRTISQEQLFTELGL